MTEVFFVGGPIDGQRRELADGSYLFPVRVMQSMPALSKIDEDGIVERVQYSEVCYREVFTLGLVSVMAPTELTAKEAYKKLLDGYAASVTPIVPM